MLSHDLAHALLARRNNDVRVEYLTDAPDGDGFLLRQLELRDSPFLGEPERVASDEVVTYDAGQDWVIIRAGFVATDPAAHSDCIQVRPLCGNSEDRVWPQDRATDVTYGRPALGDDGQGDCEACNHLVVSHRDDGCHAELRTSDGLRPCPCQLARWEVSGTTATTPSPDGAA